MDSTHTYVGIDVSKARLDVGMRTGDQKGLTGDLLAAYPNDPPGHKRLCRALQGLQRARAQSVILVVMEATGGLEATLAAALEAIHIDVAIINPRRARQCALSAVQDGVSGSTAPRHPSGERMPQLPMRRVGNGGGD